MTHGCSIRLYLADGTPSGIVTADIPTWTGKVVSAPRTRIAELIARPEARSCGIYFLTGPNPDDPDLPLAYIGQSNNVGKRLAQHNSKEGKDFWNYVAIVTYKDENLTEAHARYLESRFITIAKKAKRSVLTNGTSPDYGYLPEPDIADMEFFIERCQLIFPILGLSLLHEKPFEHLGAAETKTVSQSSQNPVFEVSAVGVSGQMVEVDGEFVVLKGSTARLEGTASWKDTFSKRSRDKLIEDGVLAPTDGEGILVFTENTGFKTPTAAAEAVLARSENGRTAWKLQDTHKTYADWQDEQVATAGNQEGEE